MPAEPRSFLAELAAKRRAQLKYDRAKSLIIENERLEDFMVRMNPEYDRPVWVGSVLETLNDCLLGKRTRLLWSMPPRHGKSELVCHLVVMTLLRNPKARIGYVTNGDDLSGRMSDRIREIARTAGVEFSKTATAKSHWATAQGGFVHAVGIGGDVVGTGFDLIIVDDPHKSMSDCNSTTIRNSVIDYYQSVVSNRAQTKDSSIVIIHTRWHPDDLIGRLYSRDLSIENPSLRTGWQYINIPAINDAGEALCPKRFDVEALLREKAQNEFVFAALFQGQPRPRGNAVFNEFQSYDKFPDDQRADGEAIGIDMAYTSKSYSDFSVAVSGIRFGDTLYITDVQRKQCDTTAFAAILKRAREALPHAVIWWWLSSVEKGTVNLMNKLGVHIHAELANRASGDKYARSTPCATAWNHGRIKLPQTAAWLDVFTDEVLSFTGVGDAHDDQVDALVACYDALFTRRAKRGVGQKRLVPF